MVPVRAAGAVIETDFKVRRILPEIALLGFVPFGMTRVPSKTPICHSLEKVALIRAMISSLDPPALMP